MSCEEVSRRRDLWISFSLLEFLTPARTRRLRDSFDPIERIETAAPAQIAALLSITEQQARCVTKPLNIPEIRRSVEQFRDATITLEDEAYSPLLRQIHDPPPALFYRGNPALLNATAISMVGSRRASNYGLSVAQRIGRELVAAGLTIVSGMARGIDAAAHQAALRNGGSTIAVLGTGIDVIYPRFHRKLFEEVEETGLIVTEFPPGTPPLPIHFPIRNRVISGLSLGTVVVEASARSGSLITARMAAEQGREVFAVPGSILSPGSEGVHRLIQSGAKLVHDLNDILEELRLAPPRERPVEHSEDEDPLLRFFSVDQPLHIDEAAEKSGESISTLSEKLLQLELAGLLRSLPGSRFVKVIRDG